MSDATAAPARIAEAQAPFASRGDDSGTHKAELQLWEQAGVDVASTSGGWCRETGSGMGATLNTGTATGAYVMVNRATWISFGNKGDYRVMVPGGPADVQPVRHHSGEPHPGVKADLGQRLVDWVTSDEGQAAIAICEVDGQQLFFPNAPE